MKIISVKKIYKTLYERNRDQATKMSLQKNMEHFIVFLTFQNVIH